MDRIFMNSKNSRIFEYHVLVFKLTDKLDLKRGQKSVADYFEYILKKYSENIDNPSIRMYVNKLKIELHLKLKMILS